VPDLLGNLLANVDRIQLTDLMAMMFLVGLVEVIFPPIPGDAIFLAGGFLAGRRGFPLAWPLLAACLGTFLAAAGLFLLGRVWGRALLQRRFFARLLPEAEQERVERWFGRYGPWVVLASRFIPVVRSGIALGAGIVRLRAALALAGLAVGIIIFNSLLIVGGSAAGENWRQLAALVRTSGWIMVSLALAVLLVLLIRGLLLRRRPR